MRPINPNIHATFPPPVMEARRWIAGKTFPADRPLIALSQAAPVDPPPAPLARAMADALMTNPESHLYGPVLGLPALRGELATQWSANYNAAITPDQVAVTAGCNQAFTSVMSTLAGPDDAVILPVPYYFNHKMWLDMAGVEGRYLKTDDSLLPDVDACAALIDDKVKAIILISPNNPCGVEYPPALIRAFYDLAKSHGIALIVDETYRDFHSSDAPPHDLFCDAVWDETFIHLYSFSKAYRLTGHRVGAIMASPQRLFEVEKFLDTVSICPPQIGQIGALWGMQNLSEWLAGERLEILARRDAVMANFQRLPDWQVLGCGAYFAYVRHPYDLPSDEVAKRLVDAAGLLVLPGTMFGPLRAEGGDGQAEATLRIAFANADADGIAQMVSRLESISL